MRYSLPETYRGTPEGTALLTVMANHLRFAKYETPEVETSRYKAIKALWWFNGGIECSRKKSREAAKQTRLRAGNPARELIARLCVELLNHDQKITPRALLALAGKRKALLTEKQIRTHLPAIKGSLLAKSNL